MLCFGDGRPEYFLMAQRLPRKLLHDAFERDESQVVTRQITTCVALRSHYAIHLWDLSETHFQRKTSERPFRRQHALPVL